MAATKTQQKDAQINALTIENFELKVRLGEAKSIISALTERCMTHAVTRAREAVSDDTGEKEA